MEGNSSPLFLFIQRDRIAFCPKYTVPSGVTPDRTGLSEL